MRQRLHLFEIKFYFDRMRCSTAWPFKPNDGVWTSNLKKQPVFSNRKSHCFNCRSLDHFRKDCKSAVPSVPTRKDTCQEIVLRPLLASKLQCVQDMDWQLEPKPF
ncbi:uncharacterized protein LOC27209144 isoform X5 [Drosophila simulans]|uniref:uncharacterized protein LOC27209144 isoform X5 n=1 Tax=Drosophila simulans TaxID=7240 RepID=UPI001D10934D|nr:uncharacterized protein LOC27209144 isoform X5 [Drosophila simulans]